MSEDDFKKHQVTSDTLNNVSNFIVHNINVASMTYVVERETVLALNLGVIIDQLRNTYGNDIAREWVLRNTESRLAVPLTDIVTEQTAPTSQRAQ